MRLHFFKSCLLSSHSRCDAVSARPARQRFLAGTIAAILTLGLGSEVGAAQYIYTPVSSAGDLWAAGTNWSAAPVSAADTWLTFVGTNTSVLANGLTNTNTNDLAGQFQLNILDLQGTEPGTGAATININSTSPATGLSLVMNGSTTPVVNLNALAGAVGLTYNVNAPVTLEATNTLFQGAGTATFKFAGGINGGTATLTKTGTSTLTLGGNSSLDGLTIGYQTVGGAVVTAPGASLSIGNGSSSSILVGGGATSTSFSGVLDVSASSSFTANVGSFSVSHNTAGSPASQTGILKLGTNNFITAATVFRVGQADNQPTGPGGSLTTAASGFTTVNTPSFTVGTGKANGNVTLGAGSIFNLAGVTSGSRTAVVVGSNGVSTGSSTNTLVDASATDATFNGTLSTLLIGNSTHTGNGNVTATMLLSGSANNHLDLNATSATFGGVLVIGRSTGTSGSGVATGTLTIGNLDFSSKIVSSNNGTGILIGQAAAAGKAVGTLNLDGGTLQITTTGSAIAGSTNGTSTVNFNGTLLRAGANSANWITGLTNANVSAGGVKVDSNGFNVNVGQALTHSTALGVTVDGGLTKSGSGVLTLSGSNTYTGATIVEGGMLLATKTAALPNYAKAGAISVFEGGTLGLNIGGTGEFTLADADMFRTNGTFSGTHSLGFDTSNAGGDLTYTSGVANTLLGISKLGANTLTLGNGTTTLGGVNVGVNNAGGILTVASGTAVTVGTGTGENLNIGVTNTGTPASGVFDVSAASSFKAEVGSIAVGSAGNNSVIGQGTLKLPANNTITATNSIVIGTSSGAFNDADSSITTGAGGLTTIQTPAMTIGGTKSRGSFTLGAGSTLDLSGTFGGTALAIGRSAVEGGTGNWSGTADLSAGIFKGNLSGLVIGHTEAGTGAWTETASLILSSNAANHLEISGATNPVVIGRWISGSVTTTKNQIAAVGTLTIGNLDSTSSIVAIDDSTAILIGTGGAMGTQRASGTLNLNGGTLTITTAGTAIGGDTTNTSNSSTVNFNGTLLKAGASSANWINGLTNANVSAGGAKFDTNGNDITIPQAFVHDPAITGADGGLTKSGVGTLTLSGVSSYTGPTTVTGGTLLVSGSISASSTTVANGGTLGGVDGTVGATIVQAGGVLSPGASSIGTLNFASTLTLAGTATFEINKTGLSLGADLANVSGALTLGGNLTVVLTGDSLVQGDTFNLFDAASFSGSFASISLPALDPGLSWDTTQLASSGTLAVIPEPGSVALLLSASSTVLGLRRFRRRPQA